jgi:hypothetical protein
LSAGDGRARRRRHYRMAVELPGRADVVMIGSGPAGATAATLLKRQLPERRIVLLEKARFPRHHVGEALLPESNSVLHKIGVIGKIDSMGFLVQGRRDVQLEARSQELFGDLRRGFLTQLAADGPRIPVRTPGKSRAPSTTAFCSTPRSPAASRCTKASKPDVRCRLMDTAVTPRRESGSRPSHWRINAQRRSGPFEKNDDCVKKPVAENHPRALHPAEGVPMASRSGTTGP